MIIEILFRVPQWVDGKQVGSDYLLVEDVLNKFWEWAKDSDSSELDKDARKQEFRDWWESLGIVGVLAEVEPPNLR